MLVTNISEVRRGHGDFIEPELLIADARRHKLLWMAQSSGMEQKTIHHAEDGRIGANSQSEREDNSGGKAGAFGQNTNGVSKV